MDLRDRVARICQSWFGQAPISVEQVHRPGAGFQELEATLPNRNVVVRLGLPVDRVRGAWALRPVFEKCGIPVAETLAASEGDEIESEPYQVFERLDGTDLLYAMDRLEDDELAQVAADVLRLMSLLSVAPSPGGFGAISNWEPGGFSSWTDRVLDEARLANLKCLVGGLLPSDTLVKLHRLLRERRGWFDAVKSTPYYAEMLARDVIICRGRVRGLVPPGVIVLGDPLELLGRCQAAWLGHSRGMAYVGALLEASNLNAEARGMADLYCALARVQWLAERRPGHPPRWGADGPAVETSAELDRHLTAELIASL